MKHKYSPFWLWYVIYDDVILIFDRIGLSWSLKGASKRAIKPVLRIVRYENNKEKNR